MISVWYVFMFAGLAILLVVVVLVRNARTNAAAESSEAPTHTANASRTPHGSDARKERKRRRAQSRHDRRKRH
jgi:uncharacterized membrane protein